MTAPAATAAATAPMLALAGVRVALGGREVLAGVDLEVRRGELLGLVGPNGAGKTTLLRAATALLPVQGAIAIAGRALRELGRLELARMVAVVQQLPEAPPTMRVGRAGAARPQPAPAAAGPPSPPATSRSRSGRWRARAAGRSRSERWRRCRAASGGARSSPARSRRSPRCCCSTSPLRTLDPEAQGAIFELLRELCVDGVGVLAVVHDLTLAAAYCDRIALLHHGRIVAGGAPERVLTSEAVGAVYGRRVSVIAHPTSGAPLVVPAVLGDG